eukprot:767527-Hanusia_phi.AAC.1
MFKEAKPHWAKSNFLKSPLLHGSICIRGGPGSSSAGEFGHVGSSADYGGSCGAADEAGKGRRGEKEGEKEGAKKGAKREGKKGEKKREKKEGGKKEGKKGGKQGERRGREGEERKKDMRKGKRKGKQLRGEKLE